VLKDLNALIQDCRNKFDALPSRTDIQINKTLKALLEPALQHAEPSATFEIHSYSITLINDEGLRADIPSSWLWFGFAFSPLLEALNEYRNFVADTKNALRSQGYATDQIKDLLKTFPLPNNTSASTSQIHNDLNNFINNTYSSEEKQCLDQFLTNREWWFIPLRQSEQTKGKTLDRGDIFGSSFNLAARVIVANSDRLPVIAQAFVSSDDLVNYFKTLIITPVDEQTVATTSNHLLRNKIYYGAPGTGKSYRIKNEIGSAHCVRTVFHPDTQYADFVGTLKPKTTVSASGEQTICYEFRPGPFTRAFIEAFKRKNTCEPVYLVVEEINRAHAAAVFGEMFQLLDRKADGSSEYSIDISDPDMLAYINKELGISLSDISLPSNLFLLATMNSSDQAVKPMDTAFKRRWNFEHIPIDYSKATSGNFAVPLSNGNTINIEWQTLAEAVNNKLKNLQIPEDRFLGHRFLSEPELNSAETARDTLCGKLFVYLWDDVLRHGRRGTIFNEAESRTFGELVNNFKQGKAVFSEELERELVSLMKTENSSTETEVVTDDD